MNLPKRPAGPPSNPTTAVALQVIRELHGPTGFEIWGAVKRRVPTATERQVAADVMSLVNQGTIRRQLDRGAWRHYVGAAL